MNDKDHKTSREIVNFAIQHNVGIIRLEKLANIRKQTSKSRKNNHSLSNWSFYRLAQYIEYKANLIGINNRDLTNGKTDLNIARRLIPMALQEPGNTLVCESGISGRDEIKEFEELGAHAFLIGESLMTSKNIPEKLKVLLGNADSESTSQS